MSKIITKHNIHLSNGEMLNYYSTGGNKKKIVLLHGNMSSSLYFDVLIEKLKDDYSIYAIDLRGFGDSSYNEPIDSLKDFADDIIEFCEKLNLEKIDLLGWSTGGGIAMSIASSRPNLVEKLFLVGSVGTKGYPIYKKDKDGNPIYSELLLTKNEIRNDKIQIMPVLKAIENSDKEYFRNIWDVFIYNMGNRPSEEAYGLYIEESLKQQNYTDVNFALTRFNISSEFNGYHSGKGEAKSIVAPTIIFQGEKDLLVPMSMAEDIKDDIGNNSTIFLLENCGHSPLLDSLEILSNTIIKSDLIFKEREIL